MRSKDQVRRAVWKAMDREGVSRFPGAEGRIPNFAGAKLAAQRLSGHRLWKRARVVKSNPDSPQTHARRIALEEGKIVVMAVPRLRDTHPFRLLDPKRLNKQQIREAATCSSSTANVSRRRPSVDSSGPRGALASASAWRTVSKRRSVARRYRSPMGAISSVSVRQFHS